MEISNNLKLLHDSQNSCTYEIIRKCMGVILMELDKNDFININDIISMYKNSEIGILVHFYFSIYTSPIDILNEFYF